MSIDLMEAPPVLVEPPAEARPSLVVRFLRGVVRLAGVIVKMLIGAGLCFHYASSLLVVGWTFRLMQRRILYGWWKRSPVREGLSFAEFASRRESAPVTNSLPNWVIAERPGLILNRPDRHGDEPSLARKLVRLPRAVLGALGANLKTGIAALACTYVLTGPGCFLWLAAWYDGWNNSFNKGYEQAIVGPLTGILGNLLFIIAMVYVPMAWAHLAATRDARAFFQFGFVWRLIRQRLAGATFYAAWFALIMLPVSILQVAPSFLVNMDGGLDHLSAADVWPIAATFNLFAGAYVFLAFVAVHLLAGRLYRSAVLRLLERDPAQADTLHPALYHALTDLRLIPEGPPPRKHPLVAVVLGTGRRGRNAVLWVAMFALWFGVVAQIFVREFLNYHPILGWMNQALIHLPSIFFMPPGSN